jgi:hypothetical protein
MRTVRTVGGVDSERVEVWGCQYKSLSRFAAEWVRLIPRHLGQRSTNSCHAHNDNLEREGWPNLLFGVA